MLYAYVENNGKTNEIVWGNILHNIQRLKTQTFNKDDTWLLKILINIILE